MARHRLANHSAPESIKCSKIFRHDLLGAITDAAVGPSQAGRQLIAKYGRGVDLIALAAIGITRRAWRNDWHGYIEDAHSGTGLRRRRRITDGEMFAANVATTRLVLEHIRKYPAVNWEALADAFVDPHRKAGQRTLTDLLGKKRYRRWSYWAWNHIAATEINVCAHGGKEVMVLYAVEGASYDDWWAGPRWPGIVDAFIDQLGTSPPVMTKTALREQLLDTPDALPPELLDWCITNQHLRYTTDRWHAERRHTHRRSAPARSW